MTRWVLPRDGDRTDEGGTHRVWGVVLPTLADPRAALGLQDRATLVDAAAVFTREAEALWPGLTGSDDEPEAPARLRWLALTHALESVALSNDGDRASVKSDWVSGQDASHATPLVLPGTLLGDYVVQAEIGRGGMGVVFRAWESFQNS